MAEVPDIVKIKEKVEAELLKRPGVTGVDVGFKYKGGKRTDTVAIRVHVEKKRDDVPKGEKIPAAIEGVETDVIERRFVLHRGATNRMKVEDIRLMADTGHYTTVKGGCSIGPCRAIGGYIFAGTLGAIVRDNASGNPFLLSNFHVMCVDNSWHAGDQMCQPSRIDTGSCPADVVGTLQRAVLSNIVDGAVCSLSGRSSACEILDIGAVAGTATAVLNAAVRKRGRTTALTYGFVDSLSLSVNVDYGDGIGPMTLTNQIGIRVDAAHNPQFGAEGDSGSVVVDDTRRVIGLYFAGSDTGDFGVANPIAAVLTALNVSMCVAKPIEKLKDFKLEKLEKFELKEHKFEKFEHKEFKFEKLELKERKPEKVEFEGPKTLVDHGGWPQGPGGGPLPFVTSEMRPDLMTGALSREADLSPSDLAALSQQLEKESTDAMQAKMSFDTKVSDR